MHPVIYLKRRISYALLQSATTNILMQNTHSSADILKNSMHVNLFSETSKRKLSARNHPLITTKLMEK